MKFLRIVLAIVFLLLSFAAIADLQVVIVEGLGGEDRFVQQFADQVRAVEEAAGALTSDESVKVFRSGEFSRDDIVNYFDQLSGRMQGDDRLAMFLIGHGSYDDHDYKFNIVGPDLTDSDLLELLENTPGGAQLLVNTGSSGGAIRERLRADHRTLILATRSGVERHATRFGHYFAAALSDSSADLDKNRVITAEEAFGFADRQVKDYFERNGQLATEHPRIDGEQAGRFNLARLDVARQQSVDPKVVELMRQRDALNEEVDSLRLRRDSMPADLYQTELLNRMLELATVEETIETLESEQ